jgi:hypothetical protein
VQGRTARSKRNNKKFFIVGAIGMFAPIWKKFSADCKRVTLRRYEFSNG